MSYVVEHNKIILRNSNKHYAQYFRKTAASTQTKQVTRITTVVVDCLEEAGKTPSSESQEECEH